MLLKTIPSNRIVVLKNQKVPELANWKVRT